MKGGFVQTLILAVYFQARFIVASGITVIIDLSDSEPGSQAASRSGYLVVLLFDSLQASGASDPGQAHPNESVLSRQEPGSNVLNV